MALEKREGESTPSSARSSTPVDLCEEAFRFIENQAAAKTSRMYRSDLTDLTRFMGARGRGLLDTTEEDAVAWAKSFATRLTRGRTGLDPITAYRKISVARTFFGSLKDAGRVPSNPFELIKAPHIDRREGRTPYHPKREVELLLGAIDPSTPRGLRDRAIALLLFANGLRVSEVAKLCRSQIGDEEGLKVLRLPGKGGRITKTTLRPEVWSILQEHVAKNAPHGEYIFRAMPRNARWFLIRRDTDLRTRPITSVSIWKMLKRAARAAGLDPEQISPHCGRVFFVTEAYKETRDIERVSRGVGHSELDTTRGYLRYLDGAAMHPALAVKLSPTRTTAKRHHPPRSHG